MTSSSSSLLLPSSPSLPPSPSLPLLTLSPMPSPLPLSPSSQFLPSSPPPCRPCRCWRQALSSSSSSSHLPSLPSLPPLAVLAVVAVVADAVVPAALAVLAFLAVLAAPLAVLAVVAVVAALADAVAPAALAVLVVLAVLAVPCHPCRSCRPRRPLLCLPLLPLLPFSPMLGGWARGEEVEGQPPAPPPAPRPPGSPHRDLDTGEPGHVVIGPPAPRGVRAHIPSPSPRSGALARAFPHPPRRQVKSKNSGGASRGGASSPTATCPTAGATGDAPRRSREANGDQGAWARGEEVEGRPSTPPHPRISASKSRDRRARHGITGPPRQGRLRARPSPPPRSRAPVRAFPSHVGPGARGRTTEEGQTGEKRKIRVEPRGRRSSPTANDLAAGATECAPPCARPSPRSRSFPRKILSPAD